VRGGGGVEGFVGVSLYREECSTVVIIRLLLLMFAIEVLEQVLEIFHYQPC
jgi:hypothetical protein